MADTKKYNVINSSRVLHKLWEKPGISRIEISEELSLDRSTITKITKQLNENNWIRVVQKNDARENIGRRPEGLIVNEQLGVVLGVEVRPRSLQGAVIDIQGNLLSTEKMI
jgi:DNA-binding transcriptional regulator LsrR (DeoR family)